MRKNSFTITNLPESVLIKGGEYWSGSDKKLVGGDLILEGGRITYAGPSRKESFNGAVIDASNKIIIPGLFDMHVHFREPGYEYKETIETGCRAATAGGVTGVCPMPNTIPAIDNAEMVRFILDRAEPHLPDVLPIGTITHERKGESLAEIGAMVKAGAVAISDDGSWVMNSQVMRLALEYAKMFDIPVISHSLDESLAADGVMHESAVSTRLGLAGIPRAAEVCANFRDIELARYTGGRLHIAHVTTKGGLELIRRAKNEGIAVTTEVTPFHLCLTDEDLAAYDPNFKLNPPLRSAEDRQALISGLADGSIDVLATDHAPHAIEEKEWEIVRAPFGCIGVEAVFPVIYTRLVKTGRISLERLLQVMVEAPRRILKQEIPAIISGQKTNMAIIDIRQTYAIRAEEFYSKGRNCPFEGWDVEGRVEATLHGDRWWLRPGSEKMVSRES